MHPASRLHHPRGAYQLYAAQREEALSLERRLACSDLMEGRRFEIEPEITSCILQAGYTILEVPISYTPRKEKKLSPWKDGWPALAMLLRRRFGKAFNPDLPIEETQQSVASPSVSEVDYKI